MKRLILGIVTFLALMGLLSLASSQDVLAQEPAEEHLVYLPIILSDASRTDPNPDPDPDPDPVPPANPCEETECHQISVLPANASAQTLPLVFEVPTHELVELPPDDNLPAGGYQATGTVVIETPLGMLTLVEADLTFERGDSPLAGIERVYGRAEFPFPEFGFADFGTAKSTVMATVGLDRGKNIEFDAPVLPERQYLFFHIEQDLEIELTPQLGHSFESLTYRLNEGATLLIDPLDPSYYIDGIIIPEIGTIATGRSFQGLIPYEPYRTYGIEDHIVNLTGYEYDEIRGLTFYNIPLAIDGRSVVNYGSSTPHDITCIECFFRPTPLAADDGSFRLTRLTFGMGVDGALSLDIPVPGDIDLQIGGHNRLDFTLREASASVSYIGADDLTTVYYSGYMDNDTPLDNFLLFHPTKTITSYGAFSATLLSGEVGDFYMVNEGSYKIKSGDFIQGLFDMTPFAFEMMPLDVNGTIRTDMTSSTFTGTTTSQLSPDIFVDGTAQLEAHVPFYDLDSIYYHLDGKFTMPIIGIDAEGTADFRVTEILMEGELAYDAGMIGELSGNTLQPLAVSGTLHSVQDGFYLKGTTPSQIHPDIAYDSANVEAFLSSTNPADSWLILTSTGNMDLAGVSLGSNGQVLIDASGISGSTNVEISVDTPKVTIPGYKHSIVTGGVCLPAVDFPGVTPNCTITVAPAKHWGKVKGEVTVLIKNDNASGSFSAKYYPTTGGSVTLSGGSVTFNPPKACVTVPAVKEVCTSL